MKSKIEKSHNNHKTNSQKHDEVKGKFLDKQTWCVYLDEFAASRIFAASPPAEWADIAVLIKQGINIGKLLCPYSIEQMAESSRMDKESAIFLDNESRNFSLGWCFLNEADISANYLISRVRKIEMQKNHFIHNKNLNRMDEPNIYEKLGERNETFRKMIKEGGASVNIIRTVTRSSPRRKKVYRDFLVNHIKNDYAEELKKRMFWLGTQTRYTPKPITLTGHDILFWADVISHLLVREHHMTQIEAQAAFWILEKEGIDAIPSLSIRASLEAMIVYKNSIEIHNDQMDILRIAGALPFADIMLIDGSKAHDVRELNLDKKFQTNIYSGKKKELENLSERLNCIILAD